MEVNPLTHAYKFLILPMDAVRKECLQPSFISETADSAH